MGSVPVREGNTQLIEGLSPVESFVIVMLCTNGMAPVVEPIAGLTTEVLVVELVPNVPDGPNVKGVLEVEKV
jgi:hypothetical protein